MKHLTLTQRYKIEALVSQNTHNQSDIAIVLGVNKSTISRELKRNSKEVTYDAKKADCNYLKYCKRDNYKIKGTLLESIIENLNIQNSPEQISGLLKKQGLHLISHEAIYLWIYQDKVNGGQLHLNLRQNHKKRRKRLGTNDRRGIIPNKVCIDDRPQEVNAKSRLGDYEGDTIIGANHKGAIVTLTERVTKLLLMEKVESKTADTVEKAIIRLLKRSPIPALTITFDNGKEFTNHLNIGKKLNCDVFFAHPYHSWERGLNENTNGLIRQYIPKKTDFSYVSKKLVKDIENNLNNRPRKTLEFNSPLEYLEQYKNKSHSCI